MTLRITKSKFIGQNLLLIILLLLQITNVINAVPTVVTRSTSPTPSPAITTTINPDSSSSEETVEVIDQEIETESTALEMSLEKFLDIVPSETIRELSTESYLKSAGVRNCFNFLRSLEFRDAKDKLLQAPEVQEFVKYLNQSGVNVVRFVRKVSSRTGIPAILVSGNSSQEMDLSESEEEVDGPIATADVTLFVDKVLTELPQELFFSIFFEKMESDNEFSEFVERLNGDEFEAILVKIQVKSGF